VEGVVQAILCKKLVGRNNSSSGGGGGGSRGHDHGRGGGRGDARSTLRERREDVGGSDGPSEKCCYRCGKPGHFAREFRSKKKAAQANLAQEEESALMLIEQGDLQFELNPRAGGSSLNPSGLNKSSIAVGTVRATERSPSTVRPVHLVEEVFAQFNDEVKKEGKRWVLDSGASSHMTGVQEIFAKLNTNKIGTNSWVARSSW
jgi:hypothetical protein